MTGLQALGQTPILQIHLETGPAHRKIPPHLLKDLQTTFELPFISRTFSALHKTGAVIQKLAKINDPTKTTIDRSNQVER